LIDERNESFKIDAIFKSRWRDPRLSASSLGSSLAGCALKLDDIWNSEVGSINLRAQPDYLFKKLNVDDDGNVEFYARLQATLTSNLDLREFPFDTQHLDIQLASFNYGPQDVVFVANEAGTGRLENATLAGWTLLSNTSDASVTTLKSANGV